MKDQKPQEDGQISLEEILAEFAPVDKPERPAPEEPPVAEPPVEEPKAEELPVAEPPVEESKAEELPVAEPPVEEPKAEEAPVAEPPMAEPEAEEPPQTQEPPAGGAEPAKEEPERERPAAPTPRQVPKRIDSRKQSPWWKHTAQPQHISEKVIQLPEADNSVTGRIGRLIEKGDRYAADMFQGDRPADPEREKRQRLLPGVDWEQEPTHAPTPRRKRVARRPKPDVPPGKLAGRYKKGLAFLHTRAFLSLLWCLPQLYLVLCGELGLPTLPFLANDHALACQISALALVISALLALDVLSYGAVCLVRLRLESETLLLFAVCAAVADALTMPALEERGGAMPYCAVVSVCLFFALWGRTFKRRGLWLSCRAAAGAAEPYLVTLDEKMWNGADAYVKWPGAAEGYGSQVQEADGAQRAYHVAAPLILLCAGLFALLASVGRQRPQLFFWCLSAGLTAGCGLTSFLSFSMPFAALSERLAKVGAALGSWDGVSWRGRHHGVILTDMDLFPPGSVTLNGIKLTGDVSLETAVAYTATLIRETGSGMEKPFSDLLRARGGLYRRVNQVLVHEGGVTGEMGGQAVCVGSGAFMELMGVTIEPGHKVKGAVFCAVDGELAAIFVLNYTIPDAIAPALDSLIRNGLDPILATRDFLVIPEMLRQRFKLPVDKMEFPGLDRRRELSGKRMEHERVLSAVLCREGLGPYAEAVVGGKRLLWAVRVGLFFDFLGAAAGLLLAFYLCLARAFAALSAGSMLVFLLLWLVPAWLVSGWASRY